MEEPLLTVKKDLISTIKQFLRDKFLFGWVYIPMYDSLSILRILSLSLSLSVDAI